VAKGIRIDFIANVRDFLRGTDDVTESLEDVSDSLDDLATDADKAGTKAGANLADGVTDGAKDADKALGKLEKSFKDALDDVSPRAKAAGDDLGKRVKHGTEEASEGVSSFKENTAANLKETAASFGSVEDALGGIQGLAAEALEGFGPAGVAASAAVALGIGVVSSKLQDIAAKTNEAAVAAGEWALAWRDAENETARVALLAGEFDTVAAKVGDARHAWEVWQKEAKTNAQVFAAAIDQGVLSTQDLADAFTSLDAGTRIEAGTKASRALATALEGTAEAWDNTKVSTQLAAGSLEQHVTLTQAEADALKAAKTAIDDKVKADKAAQAQLEALAKVSGLTVDAYLAQQEATKKASESQQAYADSLKAAADPVSAYESILSDKTAADQAAAEATAKSTKDASDSWEDYARHTKVTVGDLIRDLEAKITANKNFERSLRVLGQRGMTGLADELRAAGPQAAAGAAAALAKASDSDLRRYAQDRGELLGQDAGQGIAGGVKSTDLGPAVEHAVNRAVRTGTFNKLKVPVAADTTQMEKDIARAAAKAVKVGVDAKLRVMGSPQT
jgi:hypothetical protein